MSTSYFDKEASTWDDAPHRIALVKGVGEAILREAKPTKGMDVLDYGCGTGLVSLYLLPHVRSVTGADSSPGMLEVLQKKIAEGGIANMKVIRLDLEHESVSNERYDMIVTSMTLHHVVDTDRVLRAFREMLVAGGILCIADLDTEPGLFHPPEAGHAHNGFDREQLRSQLERIGFGGVRDVTAHTIRKVVEGGQERDFPVFLITGRRRS